MVVCRLASVPSRYPRFVDFSWSFPVNWYIQSILYTPQSSQSHSYLLRFSTSMRNCRLAPLLQAFQYASNPHAKHLPLFITASYASLRLPLLISLWCYWSTTLSSEYNPPRTRHDLYTPTLPFMVKAVHFFPAFGRTVRFIPVTFNPFMTDRVSLLIAYSLRLLCPIFHPNTSLRPGTSFSGCT